MFLLLDIGTEWFLQFWISMSLWHIPSSLGSIRITIWEEMPFEKFQDGHHGGHLGCQKGMNLAVLNFHVSPHASHQVSAQFDFKCSGADVISRFCVAILDIGMKRFSNSKSPCHPNASHQVWAQSDLPFRSRRGLKIFQMATMEAILDIGTERF